jgi:hypothetical protein
VIQASRQLLIRAVLLTFVALLSASSVGAQTQTKNDSIFAAKVRIAKAHKLAGLPIGERVGKVGARFLGVPYVSGSLDRDSAQEELVVDLSGFDCVTFYENALALSRVIKDSPKPTLRSFENALTLLRYRDGKRDGYHSRLHYSIDYFRNAEKKGLLHNVTQQISDNLAVPDTATLNFMTTHRSAYKQIRNNDAEFAAISEMERAIQAAGAFYYIPKESIVKIESGIHTGDILGIVTNIPGLDCSHTGIAVRGKDGRIHFMHASSLKHKVIITDVPLSEYLVQSSRQIGIIVMRPIEVKKHS